MEAGHGGRRRDGSGVARPVHARERVIRPLVVAELGADGWRDDHERASLAGLVVFQLLHRGAEAAATWVSVPGSTTIHTTVVPEGVGIRMLTWMMLAMVGPPSHGTTSAIRWSVGIAGSVRIGGAAAWGRWSRRS